MAPIEEERLKDEEDGVGADADVDSPALTGIDTSTEEEEGGTAEADNSTEEECEPEQDMDPSELLRRARARLLEDVSTEGTLAERGVLPLPHSLTKYKEVSLLF